jgi:serine/threonine protein kinase
MAIPEDHRTMVEEVGSSGYTAPEIYQDQGYTEKVDVWSFGILLWEIFRPIEVSNPFIGLSPDEFLHQVIDLNLRPFIAPEYPQVVQEILTFCWQIDPTKRPSMDQIQVIL